MATYVVKRLLLLVLSTLGLILIIFLMMRLLPGDPALVYLGDYYTKADYRLVIEKFGLDRPFYIQFFSYLKGVIRGDLGNSIRTAQPVIRELQRNFFFTIVLAVSSMCLASVFGIIIGIYSALRKNTISDHISRILALVGISTPLFLMGIVLLLVFGYILGWFPIVGGGSLKQTILPAITLASGRIAIITRLTRSSLLEELKEDYVRTARSKGLLERVVINKHVLKNAFLSIATIIGYQFGYVLGGSAITEIVFSRPGLGSLMVQSVFARDYPVVQGCILLFGILVAVVNLGVDLSYSIIDPRIKYH